jgi:hypothetical protein
MMNMSISDELDLRRVTFSWKDKRQQTIVPLNLEENLAHFLGIHMGDGHLRAHPSQYTFELDGHPINDVLWYETYVVPLLFHLFRRTPLISKGNGTIKLTLNSKAVHSFLHFSCGMPIGSKRECGPPAIILHAPLRVQTAFLRGLVDTDFSLVFKNRHREVNYYPVIDLQTANKNLWLFSQRILQRLGFRVFAAQRMKMRGQSAFNSFYLQVNGINALHQWLKVIGFTNPNHTTKVDLWKRQGYVQPRTTLLDRVRILSENV